MAASETLIASTSNQTISLANTVRYAPIGATPNRIGADTLNLAEADTQYTMRAGGTLSNMYVRVSTNAKNLATPIRLRKNLANANQNVSITGNITGVFEDTTNTDTVAAGDELDYQFTFPNVAGNQVFDVMSLIFLSSTSDTVVPIISWRTITVNLTTTTVYQPISGLCDFINSVENNANAKIQTDCTLRYLFIQMPTRTIGTATVRLRKNGANGNSVISASSGTGMFEDLSGIDAITAGDNVCISAVASTASGTRTIVMLGLTMITTDNKFFLGGVDANLTEGTIAFNTTTYIPITGRPVRQTTENNAKMKTRIASLDLTNLTVNVTAYSVNSTTTIRTRKNGVNGAQSVNFNTTGFHTDTTNTDSCTSSDEVNYQVVSGGSSGSLSLRYISVIGNSNPFTLFEIPISEPSISVAQTLTRGVRRFRSETAISVAETLTKNVRRMLAESSISVSDGTPRRLINRVITQTTNVSDGIAKIASKFRTVNPETVTVSADILTRFKEAVRSMAESAISVSDATISRFKHAFRTIAEPSISNSDSLVRLKIGVRTIVEPAISVVDTMQKAVVKFVAEPAVLVGGDSIRPNIIRKIVETVSVGADTLSRFKEGVRQMFENTSVNDSLTKKVTRIISEPSISVNDALEGHIFYDAEIEEPAITVGGGTLTRLKETFRELAEFVNIFPDLIQKKDTKPLAETNSVNDSLAKIAYKFRSIAESSISVGAGVLTRFKEAVRTLAESPIPVSDSLDATAFKDRALEETEITVDDSLYGERQKNRTISEIVTVDDVLDRQVHYFRNVVDDVITTNDIISVTKIFANQKRSFKLGYLVKDTKTRLEFPDVKDEFAENPEVF